MTMIAAQLLFQVAAHAQLAKKCDDPFGGLDIIVAGDFFQLPPVGATALYMHNLYDAAHAAALLSSIKDRLKDARARVRELEAAEKAASPSSEAMSRGRGGGKRGAGGRGRDRGRSRGGAGSGRRAKASPELANARKIDQGLVKAQGLSRQQTGTSPTSGKQAGLLADAHGFLLWRLFDVVVVLRENHGQKADPEFGAILSRCRLGQLTSDDIDRLNTCVVGSPH